MTEDAKPQPSANLFSNYNRVIGFTYSVIVLALVLLFAHLLQRKMDEEIAVIQGHVMRHGQFLEFVLRASSDQLESLRLSADQAQIPQEKTQADALLATPPGAWLRENPETNQFHLDALPDPDLGGNLVGIGSLRNRDAAFYEDLATALKINQEWNALVFNLPHAARARLIGARNFHAALPWQPAREVPFDPAAHESELWALGEPANNPDREKFWAPVYFGGESRGLLAPIAVPLYRDQRFIGVLSIDISLDYLNRVNNAFGYPLGQSILVDAAGKVLAHPAFYANPLDVTTAPALVEALPSALIDQLDALTGIDPDEPTVIGNYLVIRHPFVVAPWSLLFIVPRSALWWELGVDLGPLMLGFLVGLVLLMILTYVLTSREFVGPAAKLVEHIALESNFVPTKIPAVPNGWKPWFDTISKAFRESLQLVSLRQELDIAANLQQSILPREWPEDPRYRLWGRMRPAKEVGGDFYDHFLCRDGTRAIVVADVSGKGIAAGLFGMVCKTLVHSAVGKSRRAPEEVIADVNDSLAEDNDSCMFVTLLQAKFNPATGVVQFVNAGHSPPLLIHTDGTAGYLSQTNGLALGAMGGVDYQVSEARLQPGDILILFTDGVTEAINQQEQEFSTKRLVALFAGRHPSGPKRAVEDIFAAVDDFVGDAEQFDDITCVALQYLGDRNERPEA